MTEPVLSIADLAVEYRTKRASTRALDGVSLEIPHTGYTLGVVGESGSGKTTLGKSIMNAVDSPGKIVRGSIKFNGEEVTHMSQRQLASYRWQEVSMVFQSAMNTLNPVKRVSNPIVEVLRLHKGIGKGEATERALKLLSEVGIPPDRAQDYPHELSGGMKQRVVIALALCLTPRLLIADEPTSALDVVTQKQILTLLKKEVVENKLSMIFITHEISLLEGLVENVAVMYSGEVVEVGSTNDVLRRPLHPYTQMLLSTLLTLDSGKNAEAPIPSAPQEIVMQEDSCRYSDRCPYVFDRCRKERPHLREVEKGRWVSCHKY